MADILDKLRPKTKAAAKKLLALRPDIKITQGFRSNDIQAALYAKGRTLPGPIVTNAKPGQSPHNYGLAFDVCFKVGPAFPNPSTQSGKAKWAKLGADIKACGLAWGGDFKSLKDYPHAEWPTWKAIAKSEGGPV